jgi:hypothetical protein
MHRPAWFVRMQQRCPFDIALLWVPLQQALRGGADAHHGIVGGRNWLVR